MHTCDGGFISKENTENKAKSRGFIQESKKDRIIELVQKLDNTNMNSDYFHSIFNALWILYEQYIKDLTNKN